MKRVYLTTILTSLAMLLLFGFLFSFGKNAVVSNHLKVGFIYESDASAPYTYNFSLAEDMLQEEFGNKVQLVIRNNVRDEEIESPIQELVQKGCGIIFTDSYAEKFRKLAADYPDVQFCQASFPISDETLPDNYHTFKGKAYQGRYVSGIAAGMKLNEMIENRVIEKSEALVGYVAAFPSPEVISGYTAFLLGIRSVCPDAVMRVRYTNTWCSYSIEKEAASLLIEEGCRILSQHSDTIGPALACEEAFIEKPVYFVGYNMSMLNVAPSSALVSTCINWTPYIVSAVEAVMNHTPIEKYVNGEVHGNDMCAGFDLNWVEILELNTQIAAHGTQEKLNSAIDALRKGNLDVFHGDYIGVNPDDPDDTIDLRKPYEENKNFSSPSFYYILEDIITIE